MIDRFSDAIFVLIAAIIILPFYALYKYISFLHSRIKELESQISNDSRYYIEQNQILLDKLCKLHLENDKLHTELFIIKKSQINKKSS